MVPDPVPRYPPTIQTATTVVFGNDRFNQFVCQTVFNTDGNVMVMSHKQTEKIELTHDHLYRIVTVCQEADRLSDVTYFEVGHGELPIVDAEQLEILEAFYEELLAAIDRHPTHTAKDILELALSPCDPGLVLEVDVETTTRFIETCEELHLSTVSRQLIRPFGDFIYVSDGWLGRGLPDWLPEETYSS